MTKYAAIKAYLPYQGAKYVQPQKAGAEEAAMQQFKREGQAARLAFSQLAKDFQTLHPQFTLDRVSNWASQAQLGRPHFWVYLTEDGDLTLPMYALRLYGDEEDFGISVEISIIERKRNEVSLAKLARLLDVPVLAGTYYQYLEDGETKRIPASEEVRLDLRNRVHNGEIRKVILKKDIPWSNQLPEEELLSKIWETMESMRPFYEAARKN